MHDPSLYNYWLTPNWE